MKTQPLTRRQVLRGAGGFTLALPLLPSLLSTEALAQTTGAPPRLVMLGRSHGGFLAYNDLPAGATLANKQTLYPGHEFSHGPIPRTVSGGKTVITTMLQGASTVLTDAMLSRMNVIRGMDNTVAVTEHNDCAFGAIGFGNGSTAAPVPSIDQYASWSPSYAKPGTYVLRSLVMGENYFSLNFQNPATRSGGLVAVASEKDPVRIFDKLFAGLAPPAAPGETRKPLVDHVLADYQRVRNSNRRLSAEDRKRLDAHMEMMFDLQRQVNAAAGLGSCAKPAKPTAFTTSTPADYVKLYQLYNDMTVAAFKCGITRVAAVSPRQMGQDWFFNTSAQWHIDVTAGKASIASSWQVFFEKVALDLAQKLNVEEANGKTYLDNSLLIMTSDQGVEHHWTMDIPVVTLGGASGFFKTGNWVDFRNRAKTHDRQNPGITIQQFWATVLDALRIPRAEWASLATNGGWGAQAIPGEGRAAAVGDYVNGVRERAGDPIPVIV